MRNCAEDVGRLTLNPDLRCEGCGAEGQNRTVDTSLFRTCVLFVTTWKSVQIPTVLSVGN